MNPDTNDLMKIFPQNGNLYAYSCDALPGNNKKNCVFPPYANNTFQPSKFDENLQVLKAVVNNP